MAPIASVLPFHRCWCSGGRPPRLNGIEDSRAVSKSVGTLCVALYRVSPLLLDFWHWNIPIVANMHMIEIVVRISVAPQTPVFRFGALRSPHTTARVEQLLAAIRGVRVPTEIHRCGTW